MDQAPDTYAIPFPFGLLFRNKFNNDNDIVPVVKYKYMLFQLEILLFEKVQWGVLMNEEGNLIKFQHPDQHCSMDCLYCNNYDYMIASKLNNIQMQTLLDTMLFEKVQNELVNEHGELIQIPEP